MARKHQRSEIIREIFLESSAGRRLSRISDMSVGGCYIESITNYRIGEEISFDLQNTTGQVLRFQGSVAYVLEGFGFGLTFRDLTKEHLKFLKNTLPESSGAVAEPDANLLELY